MSVELSIRRLRWLQQVLVQQKTNSQFIAAVWGSLPEDSPTFSQDGRLADTANSFAKMFDEYALMLDILEAGEAWLQQWQGDYLNIFVEGQQSAEDLAKIHVPFLRQWHLDTCTEHDPTTTENSASKP